MQHDFFVFFPLKNPEWKNLLAQEHLLRAQQRILESIDVANCLPSPKQVFAALDATPLDSVRVLIVGQDPYPTPGDAHGLSFSVAHGKPPRSLVNIFTEIERDCGGPRRENANLSDWAAAGVLLLNRVLTTPAKTAGGHRRKGWEEITRAIVDEIAAGDHPLVVMLWGNDAIKLASIFPERANCLVLTSGHPSPLAYNRPSAKSFKGCGHFAAANAHLKAKGCEPINWSG